MPTPEFIARDQRLAERMQAKLAIENSLAERVIFEPNPSKRRKNGERRIVIVCDQLVK